MKRIFTGFVVLALILGVFGCCPKTDNKTGVTTKSFLNCLGKAQDIVCNPPANVMALISAVTPAVVAILNTAVPGSAAYISASNALAAIKSIQDVGCISLTSLDTLIAYLQSIKPAQMAKAAPGMAAAPINVQPLIDWEHSGGY